MVNAMHATQNPPDFIGRNRRAVKDLGKEGKRQVKDDMKQQEKGASDTVEISKSELEKLLKMAVSFQPPSPTHIRPDPSQIPGLQNQIAGLQKYYQTPGMQNQITGLYQTPGMQNQITGLQKYYQTPGMQNQMPGMHNQIQGCAQKAEVKKDPQQCEEYYPWGRPGGGAPIRTVSGALLTNYSTRGQEVEKTRNNIPQQTSVHSSSPQKPQFARGLGPHVDTFVLSQREEQRRKEQMHKVGFILHAKRQLKSKLCSQAELAAQIAERQRQKEAEKWTKEEEEKEAERRVMRELEEMNRRSERERELKQQKAVSLLCSQECQRLCCGACIYRKRPDSGRQNYTHTFRRQKKLPSERNRGTRSRSINLRLVTVLWHHKIPNHQGVSENLVQQKFTNFLVSQNSAPLVPHSLSENFLAKLQFCSSNKKQPHNHWTLSPTSCCHGDC